MSRGIVAALLLAGWGVVLAPAVTSAASAAHLAAFTAKDSGAIRALMRDYFAAFTARDYPALERYFTVPFVFVGPRPRVITNLAVVLRAWRAIRASLEHSAYAASKIVQVRVIPMTGTQAMADVHWQRLRRDGTLLNQGAELYLVTKKSGQWQIDGHMEQALALFGR